MNQPSTKRAKPSPGALKKNPNRQSAEASVKKQVDQNSVITSDAVAIRAFEIFKRLDGEHGNDWQHWFQAERELGLKPAE